MKKKKNEEPQAAKKTRELPNLSECHSCHWRIDIAAANAKTKLQLLYSEWRIVLLCKKCFSRVESSELCSYCFAAASSSPESFTCRQCNRRVHRHCDSENRTAAISSSDSSSAMESLVCADCWVPESLAKWRGAVHGGKARRSGKRSRVSAMVDDRAIEIDDKDAEFDDVVDADDDGSAQKLCSPNLSVCVCDSSREVGCLKLSIEEEDGDYGGPLKEGEGSCSNGVELEYKQEQEECVCVNLPKVEKLKGKLDPFYFKYKKRSNGDQSVLTYKRKGSNADQSVLTFKRRSPESPENLNGFACFRFTYKKRLNSLCACSMLTYKRRRPRILYAR